MFLVSYIFSIIVSLFFMLLFLVNISLMCTLDTEYLDLLFESKRLKLYNPQLYDKLLNVLIASLLIFVPIVNITFSVGMLYLILTNKVNDIIYERVQKDKDKYNNLINHYYFDD